MYRIPLPSRDASLLLSPRWGELHPAAQAALLLLAFFVPAALVLWLYRYEMRLVRRSAALALLGMRLGVLLALFTLFAVRPIAARSTFEELRGRVLVAVDRSGSMDVADPQRPAIDKLRLTRALRLADDLCTPSQLDDWIRQYETKGSPQWVTAEEMPTDPERRRQLIAERQAPHDQVSRRVDELTRAQAADRVLAKEGVGLLDAVAARHQVEVLHFAQDAWDVRPGSEAPPAKDGPPFTDLRLPLVRALERSGVDQGRVLGLVLLTDGRHNRGPSPAAKAAELGEHQLPIFPVALGARQAPPDVAIAAVRAPAAVFKDVEALVEVRLKVSGLPAQDVTVELRRPDGPALEERLRHDGTDRYYNVRFQTKLSQVGTQTLAVTARPLPGETRTDNNDRPVVINVADDKAKVLLIDGEARWEYHYLANALARDRTVQLQGVVLAQPRLGRVPEDELRRAGNPRLSLPAEPDALAPYDCVVLGDTTPEQLPSAERARLEKYVADRGGTLVLVAGKRAMPLGFIPNGAGEPLRRLLPIEEPQVVQPGAGFHVALTPEGRSTPFLQMDAAPDKSEQRWAEFPKHYWGVVGRLKPGATALASWAEEAGSRLPRGPEGTLVARQHYGFGRVLFVGLDSTWRWRYRTGDAYHHRFWGQVVRWAASDKPLVAGNEHVRFGTRDPVYRQGQEIELVVRIDEEVRPLPTEALPEAHVFGKGSDKPVAVVSLARREAQPRVLEGRLRDLPPGQYAVELAIPELADHLQGAPGPDGRPTRLRAAFTVTPPDSEEMVELATNWPLLEELAAKSGGKVFTAENAAELVELLRNQSVTREHRHEQPLWQWWGTLAALLFVLTLEWAGRKWAGLP
jgi:hypothetical protein